MLTVDDFARALAEQRVVAIIREPSAERALALGRRLVGAGVRLIEVSLGTPDAVSVIGELAATPGSLIGGGTVLTPDDARRVIDAGGSFLLSPVLDQSVIAVGVQSGVAVIPGCATPSEIVRALELGSAVAKVFPASLWGPAALRDLLQAMPGLPLLPTGGVTRVSVGEWLDAGAAGLGMGSALGGLSAPDLEALFTETSAHSSR